MGLSCGRISVRSRKTSELRVGLMGLENAGKSRILYQLELQRNFEPPLIFSPNFEPIYVNNLVVSIWEFGGSSRAEVRTLEWLYQRTCAIIFVVDSTDVQRLPEAAEALNWLCWQPELSDAIFLIYANKQDLPGALRAAQLAELFELPILLPPHKWTIQASCALTGFGVHDGMQNMLRLLNLDMHHERFFNLHNVLRNMK